jgi:hypothetical protein
MKIPTLEISLDDRFLICVVNELTKERTIIDIDNGNVRIVGPGNDSITKIISTYVRPPEDLQA